MKFNYNPYNIYQAALNARSNYLKLLNFQLVCQFVCQLVYQSQSPDVEKHDYKKGDVKAGWLDYGSIRNLFLIKKWKTPLRR